MAGDGIGTVRRGDGQQVFDAAAEADASVNVRAVTDRLGAEACPDRGAARSSPHTMDNHGAYHTPCHCTGVRSSVPHRRLDDDPRSSQLHASALSANDGTSSDAARVSSSRYDEGWLSPVSVNDATRT